MQGRFAMSIYARPQGGWRVTEIVTCSSHAHVNRRDNLLSKSRFSYHCDVRIHTTATTLRIFDLSNISFSWAGCGAEGLRYERITQITTLILALAQRYATVPRFHLAYRLSLVVWLLTHLHRVRNTAFVSGQSPDTVEERSIANALHARGWFSGKRSDGIGANAPNGSTTRTATERRKSADLFARLTTAISCRVVHLHTTSTDDEVSRARECGRVQGRRQWRWSLLP